MKLFPTDPSTSALPGVTGSSSPQGLVRSDTQSVTSEPLAGDGSWNLFASKAFAPSPSFHTSSKGRSIAGRVTRKKSGIKHLAY